MQKTVEQVPHVRELYSWAMSRVTYYRAVRVRFGQGPRAPFGRRHEKVDSPARRKLFTSNRNISVQICVQNAKFTPIFFFFYVKKPPHSRRSNEVSLFSSQSSRLKLEQNIFEIVTRRFLENDFITFRSAVVRVIKF